jgi:hypothetical protein
LESLVGDLTKAWPAVAFGVGLAFGLTFDTTGPRTEPVRRRGRRRPEVGAAAEKPVPEARAGEPDDRHVRIPEGETPQPEAPPRPGEPPPEE